MQDQVDNRVKLIKSPNLFQILDSSGATSKLVKIHGSIDWFIDREGIVTRETSEPTKMYIPRQIKGRMMAYPIQEKLLYVEPFFTFLYVFARDLIRADRWIIIGHRFNDPVIRRIFLESSSAQKKIVIVSPHADEIRKNKLKKLKGDVKPLSIEFGVHDTNLKIMESIR